MFNDDNGGDGGSDHGARDGTGGYNEDGARDPRKQSGDPDHSSSEPANYGKTPNGSDRKWHWARAETTGNSSDGVGAPGGVGRDQGRETNNNRGTGVYYGVDTGTAGANGPDYERNANGAPLGKGLSPVVENATFDIASGSPPPREKITTRIVRAVKNTLGL